MQLSIVKLALLAIVAAGVVVFIGMPRTAAPTRTGPTDPLPLDIGELNDLVNGLDAELRAVDPDAPRDDIRRRIDLMIRRIEISRIDGRYEASGSPGR